MEKEAVGNNESSFLAHNLLKLAQGNGQAAFFDINLFRCSEPQHILSPFGNGFDIEKMLYSDVLADGVSAPGAAAEGERRGELEVVKVADAAV